MILRRCKNCGEEFYAKAADVKRGWGKFCSKSCKAIHQEKHTGQYAAHLRREEKVDGAEYYFENLESFHRQ